jgi:hypothetical protein
MKRLSPWVVFAIVCALFALELIWVWQALPDRVFMFWNANREPGTIGGEWGSKAQQFGKLLIRVFITVLPLLVLVWLLPRRHWKFAGLPHRDYWLAPERRAQTIQSFQRQAVILATGIVAVWAFAPLAMVQANRSLGNAPVYFLWGLVTWPLVVMIIAAIFAFREQVMFKHPPLPPQGK